MKRPTRAFEFWVLRHLAESGPLPVVAIARAWHGDQFRPQDGFAVRTQLRRLMAAGVIGRRQFGWIDEATDRGRHDQWLYYVRESRL